MKSDSSLNQYSYLAFKCYYEFEYNYKLVRCDASYCALIMPLAL